MSVVPRVILAGLAALVLSLDLAGCSSLDARTPYTSAEAVAADIPGMPNVRFYADAPAAVFDRWRHDVYAQAASRHEAVSVIALSSGGSDGAFGAGFLKGLSESHQRPQFTIVTGVSTGALMAPFVFLGQSYDGTLQDLYTSGYAASLVKSASVLNGLFGNALVDSDRLGRMIRRYVTEETLKAVAAEHAKGRRLLIVSTNLDSQRSVVWDMGAIASFGTPEALNLFRQVLAASASVPALFPPRLIQVTAGGKSFQEMHADGATVRQIYVAPDEVIFSPTRKGGDQPKDLYVLVNNKIDPVFQVVDNGTVAVAARALSTVIKREGRNNVLSAYAFAANRGIGFHLAYIASDAPDLPSEDAQEQFSTSYMQEMFARGEAEGRQPSPWASRPPLATDPAPPAAVTASR